MGFGEGRVAYLVHLLESSPAQSLFVIEGPETSLHENAQHELAKYFIDVCNRRSHQIILTTHSSPVSEGMPPTARKFVYRSGAGVKVYDRLSSNRVRSALSNGHNGKILICVEDDFAGILLREMLRRHDASLLQAISIIPISNNRAVANAQDLFTKAAVKLIAVRDADTGKNEAKQLYSFPGSIAPEKEVFSCNYVTEKILEEFSVDIGKLLYQYPDTNHHHYVSKVAELAKMDEAHIKVCVVKWFLDAQGPAWGKEFLDKVVSCI